MFTAKSKKFFSLLLTLFILLSASTTCGEAWAQKSAAPKLVLLLVVDQFSYDYLTRFQNRFGNGGFNYLLSNGAVFTNCKYKQATTQTAVGHSVISTGAFPWTSGVIANSWYDRRKGKTILAASDDSAQLIGGNGAGSSNKTLNGTTIGDEIRLSSGNRSKVVTLSLKDRAALFLAGHGASGAYWFDTHSGNFVSSSEYGSELPYWIRNFNDQHYADKFFGQAWQKSLSESAYDASTRDDYPYEKSIPGDGKQFPHAITGGMSAPGDAYYSTFAMTPWSNQMLADLAAECIEKENMGGRGETDLLAVSFSATDYLGHAFGPNSQEIEDMFIKLDHTIGGLLQVADRKVGLNNCLVAVTGDHGVSAIPEFLKEKGLDAGRIDPKSFKDLLNATLSNRLGAEEWITAFDPPNLYLNLAAIDKQKYRQPDVEALSAKLAHSIPGIAEVYTAAQFFLNQLPVGSYTQNVEKSYYWGRSGELYVIAKPGYIFSADNAGTSHGSPYNYDSQVPLILCGSGIKSGNYGQSSSPADISATIAAILHIGLPSLCEGRVLHEALAPTAGPPTPIGAQ